MKFSSHPVSMFAALLGASLFFLTAQVQAQDIRTTLFKNTDALMQQAKDARADLLSPKNFAAAEKAYSEAGKDVGSGRADRAKKSLQEADAYLAKALEACKLAEVTFANTLKVRALAVDANAAKFEPDMWAAAEKQFNDAAIRLEAGSVGTAQSSAKKATKLYDDAELAAIKTAIVGNARNLIKQDDDDKVGKFAPETLKNAKAYVAKAETDLDRDRYATAGPQMAAAEAEYQARHARYLAGQVEALNKKKITGEALILEWEKPLRDVAGALGASTDMTNGYAVPGAEALANANSLTAANEEMAARIGELELELGGTEMVVEETARLQRQLKEVESLFRPDQARVLREGNDLIMRLIGLSFPVGNATIQTQYFGLLKRVQEAISIFPNSPIVVEGHTDSQGADGPNMQLSQQRADAVREYLIANLGLDPSRVTAVGYGKTRPIAANETAEGRAQNRRIDVVIKNARSRGGL
jgi:outer membrane protein OmpA-like peptidoglycan-associated protein